MQTKFEKSRKESDGGAFGNLWGGFGNQAKIMKVLECQGEK